MKYLDAGVITCGKVQHSHDSSAVPDFAVPSRKPCPVYIRRNDTAEIQMASVYLSNSTPRYMYHCIKSSRKTQLFEKTIAVLTCYATMLIQTPYDAYCYQSNLFT